MKGKISQLGPEAAKGLTPSEEECSHRREQPGPAEGVGIHVLKKAVYEGMRQEQKRPLGRKHLENSTRQGKGRPGVLTGRGGEQVASRCHPQQRGCCCWRGACSVVSLSVPQTLDFPACLVTVAPGNALGSEHHHNGNSVNSETDLKRFLHCVSWFPPCH